MQISDPNSPAISCKRFLVFCLTLLGMQPYFTSVPAFSHMSIKLLHALILVNYHHCFRDIWRLVFGVTPRTPPWRISVFAALNSIDVGFRLWKRKFQFPEFLQAFRWCHLVLGAGLASRWSKGAVAICLKIHILWSAKCGPVSLLSATSMKQGKVMLFPLAILKFLPTLKCFALNKKNPRGLRSVAWVAWASRNMWVDTSAKDWSPFDTAFSCWKCMEVHVFLFNWMRWFSPSHAKRVLGPNEIKQLLLYWTCAEIMTN